MRGLGTGRNEVYRLTASQALAGANATVIFATGSVVGIGLAPVPSLATLPISCFIVGTAATTLPAGMIADRYGRAPVFLLGHLCGVMAGLSGAFAIYTQSFPLFCLATFLGGAFAATVLTFRFAAAECVAPELRAKALSTVLIGGIAAGIVGGTIATLTLNLVPGHPFVGSYLAISGTAICSGLIIAGIRLPRMPRVAEGMGRPLRGLIGQPRFVSAVICGVVSYLLMNFLMTSAPLVMRMHGLSQDDANLAVQWHVVAMYAPSFFVGSLITRFGSDNITILGLLITAGAATLGLMGLSPHHFWGTLIVLGIGWNLGFSGASTMVMETHRPEDSARVQSFNDFLIFGSVMIGSFASGGVLARYGWEVVCWLVFPPVAAAIAALLFFGNAHRRTIALGEQAGGGAFP